MTQDKAKAGGALGHRAGTEALGDSNPEVGPGRPALSTQGLLMVGKGLSGPPRRPTCLNTLPQPSQVFQPFPTETTTTRWDPHRPEGGRGGLGTKAWLGAQLCDT